MKNLVRNASQPEMHLANSATHDAGSTFIKLTSAEKFNFETAFLHNCVLSVPRATAPRMTTAILGDLRLMGCDADCLSVNGYAVAHIMGVHFRADEWLTGKRCGSVVTCVMDGQSLYARVTDFLTVDGDSACPGYAIVKWFSKPKYPYGTWLIPVVTLDGSDIEDQYGCVVRITDIDPSQISVGRNSSNDIFHMMRESGYDTCTLLS